ncbi:MAG: hypothetical protein QOI45_43, partial [Thermoleophilaceae bacterium]|nr:hypothetical protein [Thermoleophilaceae bacterium]
MLARLAILVVLLVAAPAAHAAD